MVQCAEKRKRGRRTPGKIYECGPGGYGENVEEPVKKVKRFDVATPGGSRWRKRSTRRKKGR